VAHDEASSGTRKPKPSAPARYRAKPIWEQHGLRVFEPKGKNPYYRLLGRLSDGTPIDTSGGRTKDGAIAAALDILARHQPGAGDLTHRPFSELLKAFIEPENHGEKWSRRHAGNVAGLVRNHVPDDLWKEACRNLRPGHFERMLNRMRARGMAPATVERVGATMRAAITFGRKHGYLDQGHDPMFGVSYSAGGRTRRAVERQAAGFELWVPEDARPGMDDKNRLATAMREVSGLDWWWLATHVAGECGLRWGELIRLTPDRINFEKQAFLIDRQWSENDDGTFESKLPKMGRRRLVPFPAWMTEDLRKRSEQVAEDHASAYRSGRSRNEFELLFPTREGRIPRRGNWNRRVITPARLEAKWPVYRKTEQQPDGTTRTLYDWQWSWHSLRHLFCSHAISKNGLNLDPEVAADIAGHTPDVFRKMYVDARPDRLALALEAMNRSDRPEGTS